MADAAAAGAAHGFDPCLDPDQLQRANRWHGGSIRGRSRWRSLMAYVNTISPLVSLLTKRAAPEVIQKLQKIINK